MKEKIKIFKEKDPQKVKHSLTNKFMGEKSQNTNLESSERLATQVSNLRPVQNYLSTDDQVYKEPIEAHRVRQAIQKFNDKVSSHNPVSIVEKKKQERIFDHIEAMVTNNKKAVEFNDTQSQLSRKLTNVLLHSPSSPMMES